MHATFYNCILFGCFIVHTFLLFPMYYAFFLFFPLDMDSLVEGVAPTIRTANMLRLILIWSFHNNLIRLQTPASEVC